MTLAKKCRYNSQLSRGGVGGEGKSGESVHDVNPEQLTGGEHGLFSGGDGGYEDDSDSDVD